MLVSHRNKFIYTKTQKTAGTSIESFFERFCMPDGAWVQTHQRPEYDSEFGIIGVRGNVTSEKWYNHMPADAIKKNLSVDVWNDYFKFCAVRNPFDKALSAFYHFKAKGWQGIDKLTGSDSEMFEQWLEAVGPPIDRGCYVINGGVCMDFFIRYESLQLDIKTVCSRLKIDFDPIMLPRFKSQFRPKDIVAHDIYTNKAKAIVAKHYEFELDFFGYSFDDDFGTCF